MLYIHFFHGRENPNQQMKDWGSNGPVVGPITIGWTYGKVRIFDEKDYFIHLPQKDDMISLTESNKTIYYGDFSIFDTNNTNENEFIEANSNNILTLEQFISKYKIKL